MNRKNRYLWLLWSGILGGGVTAGEWVVRSTDAYAALNFSSDYHGILVLQRQVHLPRSSEIDETPLFPVRKPVIS